MGLCENFPLKPAVQKEQCYCPIPQLMMFIVVECKKWALVSAENENSHRGLFPCVCLSVFSPSSIHPSWYTACSGILTQPIKLLSVHEYALEGLCKRFRFRQLMFLFLPCRDLQCVCVCVCLNIYPSERIRFSCKTFTISLPLGTALI